MVIGMLGLSTLTATGIDLKPDVHLTLHLEEEIGALILEVPSVLPRSWIEKFKESVSDNLGVQLDIVTTQRESKDFLAFTIEFESLSAMQGTLTRALLPGIMGSELLPGVFDVFEYRVDKSVLSTVYELQAEVGQESASRLGTLFDLYYHIDVPGAISEHNAPRLEAGLPTWTLSPGSELKVYVRSQVILGISPPSSVGWVGVALSLVGGGILIAFAIWVMRRVQSRRRRQSGVLDPLESHPLKGEYGSWSEAMEDVEGVYVTDYDGSYIDTDEEDEAELDDYM